MPFAVVAGINQEATAPASAEEAHCDTWTHTQADGTVLEFDVKVENDGSPESYQKFRETVTELRNLYPEDQAAPEPEGDGGDA